MGSFIIFTVQITKITEISILDSTLTVDQKKIYRLADKIMVYKFLRTHEEREKET